MSDSERSNPWPSDPKEFFDTYMRVLRLDKEIANAMGVKYDPGKETREAMYEDYAEMTRKMDAFDNLNG